MRSRKAQMMGMGMMVGIITAVMVFFMLSAFLPSMVQMMGLGKGNDAANCPGYVDTSATTALGGGNNKSYNPSLPSDNITCSILNVSVGMVVLSIVFAVIAGIISGRIASTAQAEPSYPQYQPY